LRLPARIGRIAHEHHARDARGVEIGQRAGAQTMEVEGHQHHVRLPRGDDLQQLIGAQAALDDAQVLELAKRG
jgi:hypothetical protein